MKLSGGIEAFVERKRAEGLDFQKANLCLKGFCRHVGDLPLDTVSGQHVLTFLDASQVSANTWRGKHSVLRHFFEFWEARGEVLVVRMPPPRPAIQRTFIPYTFSREDIRRLLRTTRQGPNKWPCTLDPQTMRTLVMLLYATGALVGEMLGLTSDDVDLKAGFITIHSSRSYRTRCIPVGADLRSILKTYVNWKHRRKLIGSHFLLYSDGRPLRLQTAGRHFRKLCQRANVLRYDEATYQPRMQDLRHTFAVHRITSWIKKGADMNRMLPALSAYMGQVGLASTERYLLLTPERFRKELNKLSPQRQKKHWRDNPRVMKFLSQL